jgi:hypothetical protein
MVFQDKPMPKQKPCKENQWLCEVHHFLMPDGHCTCKETKKKIGAGPQKDCSMSKGFVQGLGFALAWMSKWHGLDGQVEELCHASGVTLAEFE